MQYVNEGELKEFCICLKQYECPYCHRVGKLNLHGYLRGYSESAMNKGVWKLSIFDVPVEVDETGDILQKTHFTFKFKIRMFENGGEVEKNIFMKFC